MGQTWRGAAVPVPVSDGAKSEQQAGCLALEVAWLQALPSSSFPFFHRSWVFSKSACRKKIKPFLTLRCLAALFATFSKSLTALNITVWTTKVQQKLLWILSSVWKSKENCAAHVGAHCRLADWKSLKSSCFLNIWEVMPSGNVPTETSPFPLRQMNIVSTQDIPVAQTVKNLPVTQETWVRSLAREDPLEKGIATHSSILAWRIPWTEDPGSYSPWGHKELDMIWVTNTHARIWITLLYGRH